MREKGVIARVEGREGVIHLSREGGCAGCGLNRQCHATGPGTRELRIQLPDNSYRQGDTVEIETSPASVLTASFMIFIFPLITSFAAYFLFLRITGQTHWGVIGFLACLIISVLLVGGMDRLLKRTTFFKPRIVGKTGTATD